MSKKQKKNSQCPTMSKSLAAQYSKYKGLTVYICSHKPFKAPPEVEAHPEIYKIITCCDDEFPKTNLEILRVSNMDTDYDHSENILLNEYEMINAIYNQKNIPEYVGICHYRRYYDYTQIQNIAKNIDYVFNELGYKILLGTPIRFKETPKGKTKDYNNKTWFAEWHSEAFWGDFRHFFLESYPELTEDFNKMENDDYLHNSFMMIMGRDLFNEICEFQFGVYDMLKDKFNIHNREESEAYVQKHKDEFIKDRNPYYAQSDIYCRTLGYLLERSLGVFLRMKHEDLNGKSLIEASPEIQWSMSV